MKLTDKVALVTGGGTGIGRAAALALAREGAAVGVNYSRSQAEAEETAREIDALGGRALPVKADVTSDQQARAMIEKVVGEFGRLDVLVNSAGWTRYVPLHDLEGLTEDDWDRCMAVNVKGIFFCVRAAAPEMRKVGSGCVVNVASIAGIMGIGSSAAYCASKAAVICLTKSLARGLAPEIRVNSVAPGFVDTRWTEGWDEFRERSRSNTPMLRVAAAGDVAEVILGLVTGAGFVTGQTIPVDGGLTY